MAQTAQQGGRKVVILHPAEAMNLNAANALLKSLEEPTAETYLLLITDQIAVMAYNSALTSPFDYIDWYAYQVETYARTLDEMGGAGVELLIGIPTYGNEPPGHDVNVENMSTAINGLRKGIDLAGNAGRHVTGAAIYGWWETDETEWLQFNQGWVNR